ncbi:MAG: ethanolamine utilization protein EutN [Acidobacteria bacterium]|nr:MAG: ethanolamine utilization protein EutN [Acidobacteriota bacterium]
MLNSSFIIYRLVEVMFLARVVGNVVATIKDPQLAGKKILVVQPVDSAGRHHGSKLLALDSVGAGAGETVYCCRGREASFPWWPDEVPTETTIVAIVDRVNRANVNDE